MWCIDFPLTVVVNYTFTSVTCTVVPLVASAHLPVVDSLPSLPCVIIVIIVWSSGDKGVNVVAQWYTAN